MPIHELDDRVPAISAAAYLAPSAVIVGDVSIGADCYVGHGAILRGDYGSDGATVGMRAVVSDFAEVGEGALMTVDLAWVAGVARGRGAGWTRPPRRSRRCDSRCDG